MSCKRTPEQWAHEILSKPMGLGDDYGNLLISLGATEQQYLNGPERNPKASEHPTENRHKQPSTKCPGKLKPACSTCHARKIRCDLPLHLPSSSGGGKACTNCARAGLADSCRRHCRKRREREGGDERARSDDRVERDRESDGKEEAEAEAETYLCELEQCPFPDGRLLSFELAREGAVMR